MASPGLTQGRLDESRKPIQHCTPPFLLRLQGLLTLFAEFFASFDHSTSALSVPGLYCSLRWIHIALQTAVPSHSTQGCGQPHPGGSQCTAPYGTVSLFCGSIPGLFLALGTPKRSQPLHSPQCLLDSNESRSRRTHTGSSESGVPIQEEPWVLLVHSPLLQQSRLLDVPPLSDMLKFGGSFHVRQVTRAMGPRDWTAGVLAIDCPTGGLTLVHTGSEADASGLLRHCSGEVPQVSAISTAGFPFWGSKFQPIHSHINDTPAILPLDPGSITVVVRRHQATPPPVIHHTGRGVEQVHRFSPLLPSSQH